MLTSSSEVYIPKMTAHTKAVEILGRREWFYKRAPLIVLTSLTGEHMSIKLGLRVVISLLLTPLLGVSCLRPKLLLRQGPRVHNPHYRTLCIR